LLRLIRQSEEALDAAAAADTTLKDKALGSGKGLLALVYCMVYTNQKIPEKQIDVLYDLNW